MRANTRQAISVAACLLLSACAATGARTLDSLDAAGVRPRPHAGARDPITADEIARINVASAYDAIARLRATYLSSRGVGSVLAPVRSTRPVVFVDGMELGTIFELRSIPARDVAEIRYLSSGEATVRYGQGYMAGIIHVTTKH